MADLEALAAFINSIPSDEPLTVAKGLPGISRLQLADLYNELAAGGGLDEQDAAELAELRVMREELGAYIEHYGVDQLDDQLVTIVLGEPELVPNAEDPAGVLGQLFPQANPQMLAQVAALLSGQQAPPPQSAPARPARVRAVATAPRAQLVAPPRQAAGRRDVPGSAVRYPVPANPPPHVPITADALFGLQRGQNGRYDSGGVG